MPGASLTDDEYPTIGTEVESGVSDRNVLSLRIVRDSIAMMRSLPQSGSIVIGRSRDADIQIDHPGVSRRHVRLHIGPEIRVEDLGSANGTRVRSRTIEPRSTIGITPGEVIEIGSVVLVVQRGRLVDHGPRSERVVASTEMADLEAMVARVASGTLTILVRGETGVGKDVMAERIHALSPRASAPLVKINCAALSEALLASELFGHERGAFTGADQAKVGLIEAAHTGTAFLDEIGELTPSLQAKLLRVLEDGAVHRVGAVKPRAVDVRFVAATNRDLETDIEAGTFRRDLFFRLNGFSVSIPPLRERTNEIEALARVFVTQASQRVGRATPPSLSAETLALLMRYTWPGNVRELRNAMERAVLISTGTFVGPEHLPVEISVPRERRNPSSSSSTLLAPEALDAATLRSRLNDVERERVVAALAGCGGNQTEAAKVLGMSRNTLLARLTAFDLTRPRKGR